jgi:uncharacterized protein (TIRG00374 family)
LKRFFVFLISITLIILLILLIGPQNIWDAIITADFRLILFAIFIHLFVVWLRSIRWGYIIKQPTEFKKNFVVKTIGLFAGNFSPMRSAGEVLNAAAGKKISNIPFSMGLSAGLTERFFDGVLGVILLSICILLFPQVRLIAILGVFASFTLLLIIYLLNWREETSLWIYKAFLPLLNHLPLQRELIDNFHRKYTNGVQVMIKHTRSFTSIHNMLIVFSLSAGSWIMECFRLYVVFIAFNIEISFLAVIIIFMLANIIGVLTALPGGIGSIELSLTGLMVIFGVSPDIGGSIAIVDRIVSFWIVTFLGIIFSTYYAQEILDEVKNF